MVFNLIQDFFEFLHSFTFTQGMIIPLFEIGKVPPYGLFPLLFQVPLINCKKNNVFI